MYENTKNGVQPVAIHQTVTLAPEQCQKIELCAEALYQSLAAGTPPVIQFDLRGRAAGQWRCIKNKELLRFNPEAFILDWDAHFPATVAHEVAHSIVYRRMGHKKRQPHGPEWRAVMHALGFPARVTHQTPLSGKRTRAYIYLCSCQEHRLGPRRHFLITQQGYRYHCKQCGDRLDFTERSQLG